MRSLLFVPADGGSKLDKAFASGADAVIVDLEDSIAHDRKAAARASAAAFLRQASQQAVRPRLLVRVNGLATGETDADLDAVVAARPDAILLPKAEGGASVMHAHAKLSAHEAIAGLADGDIKIVAQAIETAAGIFQAGNFHGASARLIGLTWGPEDLSAEVGAEANRDTEGRLTEPYRLARPRPPRSRPSMWTSAISTACGAKPKKRAATASSGGSRSTPRRSPSSTRCSPRPRRRSRKRARSWRPS